MKKSISFWMVISLVATISAIIWSCCRFVRYQCNYAVDGQHSGKHYPKASKNADCNEKNASELATTFSTTEDEDGWKFGAPYRIEPQSPDLPDSGSTMLCTLLGWREYIHVDKAASGFIANRDGPFEYVRSNGTTKVRFPRDWEIEIDDLTGRVLVPEGLPYRSDEEINELAKKFLADSMMFDRYRDAYRITTMRDGEIPRELVEIRTNEIRRVSDKIVVGFRPVFDKQEDDDTETFYVIWINAWTGEVIENGFIYRGG